MTFLEALKTGKPMRRASMGKYGPVPEAKEEAAAVVMAANWIFLRFNAPERESLWIHLGTGLPVALNRLDYAATDWEVLT